jgi:hypothetical protein
MRKGEVDMMPLNDTELKLGRLLFRAVMIEGRPFEMVVREHDVSVDKAMNLLDDYSNMSEKLFHAVATTLQRLDVPLMVALMALRDFEESVFGNVQA